MPRRPLLAAVTLSTLTLLTACHGSPEAGRPNTTPPPSTPATTNPTPIPTAPSTPTWTPAEQAAITAATARYKAATAAMDQSFANPSALNRLTLEKAGLSGELIIMITDQARTLSRSGLYQTGSTQISNIRPLSVTLDKTPPEVNLTSCLDSSKQVIRFQKDGKPALVGAGNGDRHKVRSRLIFASPTDGGEKIWYLIGDKDTGPC